MVDATEILRDILSKEFQISTSIQINPVVATAALSPCDTAASTEMLFIHG